MILAKYKMIYKAHADRTFEVTQIKNLISREVYVNFVKVKMAEYDELMAASNLTKDLDTKKDLKYKAGLIKKEISSAVGEEFFVVGSPIH